MDQKVSNTTSFNQNISNCNMENVIDMHAMFYKAILFTQNIGHWNSTKMTNIIRSFIRRIFVIKNK